MIKLLRCQRSALRARSSMAEQWPFKPTVEGSNPSALIKKAPHMRGFFSCYSLKRVSNSSFIVSGAVCGSSHFAINSSAKGCVAGAVTNAITSSLPGKSGTSFCMSSMLTQATKDGCSRSRCSSISRNALSCIYERAEKTAEPSIPVRGYGCRIRTQSSSSLPVTLAMPWKIASQCLCKAKNCGLSSGFSNNAPDVLTMKF